MTMATMVTAAVTSPSELYSKMTLDSKDAVCLDGSAGAYYIRRATATSGDSNKWYIHYEGGGWCTTWARVARQLAASPASLSGGCTCCQKSRTSGAADCSRSPSAHRQ